MNETAGVIEGRPQTRDLGGWRLGPKLNQPPEVWIMSEVAMDSSTGISESDVTLETSSTGADAGMGSIMLSLEDLNDITKEKLRHTMALFDAIETLTTVTGHSETVAILARWGCSLATEISGDIYAGVDDVRSGITKVGIASVRCL